MKWWRNGYIRDKPWWDITHGISCVILRMEYPAWYYAWNILHNITHGISCVILRMEYPAWYYAWNICSFRNRSIKMHPAYGKPITISGAGVRETGVSRHHRDPRKGHPETTRKSQKHGIKGFNRGFSEKKLKCYLDVSLLSPDMRE